MRTQVQKWGNSLALRIPRALAAESEIEQGCEVELSLDEGRLVIAPVKRASRTLDSLLAGVTKDNQHGEVDTGPSVGREAWWDPPIRAGPGGRHLDRLQSPVWPRTGGSSARTGRLAGGLQSQGWAGSAVSPHQADQGVPLRSAAASRSPRERRGAGGSGEEPGLEGPPGRAHRPGAGCSGRRDAGKADAAAVVEGLECDRVPCRHRSAFVGPLSTLPARTPTSRLDLASGPPRAGTAAATGIGTPPTASPDQTTSRIR